MQQHFVKFLGIHVESSLGWQTHINHVAKKISRGLYMLRILKNNITNESLLSVYYAYVHSHLNYGILLWGNHTSAHTLFVLQKRALRLSYAVSPRTHCKPLFVQSGILTLPAMFVLASLLYARENINSFIICNSVHNYSTRNNSYIYINRCKYSRVQNTG